MLLTNFQSLLPVLRTEGVPPEVLMETYQEVGPILVIDDDEGDRRLALAALRVIPTTEAAVACESLIDAVEQLRDGLQPSVVILDLSLPGISSLWAGISMLRAQHVRAPVIVWTGRPDALQAPLFEALIHRGADDVVLKEDAHTQPILVRAVRAAIHRRYNPEYNVVYQLGELRDQLVAHRKGFSDLPAQIAEAVKAAVLEATSSLPAPTPAILAPSPAPHPIPAPEPGPEAASAPPAAPMEPAPDEGSALLTRLRSSPAVAAIGLVVGGAIAEAIRLLSSWWSSP